MNAFDYLFEENYKLEKRFLLGDSESISFKNLYADCTIISNYLVENYGVNNKIILLSENSLFFLYAYLSVVKSGNICVPLDPSIEFENLSFIQKELDSKLFFVSNKCINKLKMNPIPLVINESKLRDIRTQSLPKSDGENLTFDGDSIMEILFTSGSTGEPKGVMLSHNNIIANSDSIIKYLHLNKEDRACVVLPFFYCYGLSVLHTHLKVGASMVLNNNFMFLGTVFKDIQKYSCSGFSGVPSHFQILLQKANSLETSPLSSLKYVTQAGGKLHNVFIEKFINIFPNVKFYVMYGQTEATARLSFLEPDVLSKKMGSIGKAIPGVQLKITNTEGEEVLDNKPGELIAKGANIMQGYYLRESESKEILRNGWLYTGDIAQKDEDGYFYLVGRLKEIFKVRGKRVSPKEIEAVILRLPKVINCLVSKVEDNIVGEAIKVTIIAKKNVNEYLLKEEIIAFCNKNLSSFKVPKHIEFITEFEYKLNGKFK